MKGIRFEKNTDCRVRDLGDSSRHTRQEIGASNSEQREDQPAAKLAPSALAQLPLQSKITARHLRARNQEADWRYFEWPNDGLVIGGYLDSTAQSDAIGALSLGLYERGHSRLFPTCRHRLQPTYRQRAMAKTEPRRAKKSPFASGLGVVQRRGVHWMRPELLAPVRYRPDRCRLLRHAAFKGLYKDTAPMEIE